MTNSEIINFWNEHWIFICIIIVSVIKFIPAEWIGLNKMVGTTDPKRHFVSLFQIIVGGLFEAIARSSMNLSIAFGLGNVVTFLIFAVVIFDIAVRKEISTQAVSLISIGVLALYLDELVKEGKEMSFFGLATWKRKDK